MRPRHFPSQNRFLAALPPAEYRRLLPHLKLSEWSRGMTLCTGGLRAPFMYFPVTGIAALIRRADNCRFSEVAVTGNDGVVGIDLIMAGENSHCRAEVLSEGHAYRIDSDTLAREFMVDSPLQQALLNYTQSLILQIARNAACNRRHLLEERLCRWLLTCLDRTLAPQLRIPQRVIASSMAAAAEDVAEALLHLELKAIITVHSDHVAINDRLRLEARACECYVLINAEAMRWMPCGMAA